jgi:hypothetical protein
MSSVEVISGSISSVSTGWILALTFLTREVLQHLATMSLMLQGSANGIKNATPVWTLL